ncbi:MAG TPA: FHA domain-containing protein [Intrasporangium sp.]|uniref:FHA domain-containing protein FhaB/FipA n=1 Tax=Intrasporangium sp. TaxID=1925024 RepID=UPI002D77151B|nr:FHA domain-containing protein [Intrasporangium sp.]HET7397046.1 FHA domain-containing protein [Intrasporangium sp.]
MSELTLTLLRLGLLVLLWIFIFSIAGVLRSDIYGTRVSRRGQRQAQPVQAAPQDGRGRVATAAVPAPARGRSRGRTGRVPTSLIVTEGALAGTSLPLRASGVLIGRNPECALVVDDDYASGRHCRIYAEDGQWFVEDLGSTNGTFLGREKLTAPRPVQVGSTLRIGKTVVELRG